MEEEMEGREGTDYSQHTQCTVGEILFYTMRTSPYNMYFTVECVLHYRRRGAARGGRFMHKANAVNEVDFRVGGGVEGSDKWSFNHHLSNMIIYQTHFSIFIKHWKNVPRRQAIWVSMCFV